MGTSPSPNHNKFFFFTLGFLILIYFFNIRACPALDLNLTLAKDFSSVVLKPPQTYHPDHEDSHGSERDFEEEFLIIPFRFMKVHFNHVGFRLDFCFRF